MNFSPARFYVLLACVIAGSVTYVAWALSGFFDPESYRAECAICVCFAVFLLWNLLRAKRYIVIGDFKNADLKKAILVFGNLQEMRVLVLRSIYGRMPGKDVAKSSWEVQDGWYFLVFKVWMDPVALLVTRPQNFDLPELTINVRGSQGALDCNGTLYFTNPVNFTLRTSSKSINVEDDECEKRIKAFIENDLPSKLQTSINAVVSTSGLTSTDMPFSALNGWQLAILSAAIADHFNRSDFAIDFGIGIRSFGAENFRASKEELDAIQAEKASHARANAEARILAARAKALGIQDADGWQALGMALLAGGGFQVGAKLAGTDEE